MSGVAIRIRKLGPDLYEGTLVVPAGRYKQLHAKGVGVKKADAIARAGAMAESIAENPLLAAVLPPGTGVAVKAASEIASAVASGKASAVAGVLGKYTGDGAKRLAKWLHF